MFYRSFLFFFPFSKPWVGSLGKTARNLAALIFGYWREWQFGEISPTTLSACWGDTARSRERVELVEDRTVESGWSPPSSVNSVDSCLKFLLGWRCISNVCMRWHSVHYLASTLPGFAWPITGYLNKCCELVTTCSGMPLPLWGTSECVVEDDACSSQDSVSDAEDVVTEDAGSTW